MTDDASGRGTYRGAWAVVLPLGIFAGLATAIWGLAGAILGFGTAIGLGYAFGGRRAC